LLIIQVAEQVALFPQSLSLPSAKLVGLLFLSSSFSHQVCRRLLLPIGSGAVSAGFRVGAGAVAGAVAGRALENAVSAREGLEISVRLDSGTLIAVLQPLGETFKAGERVRVLSGANSMRVTH